MLAIVHTENVNQNYELSVILYLSNMAVFEL